VLTSAPRAADEQKRVLILRNGKEEMLGGEMMTEALQEVVELLLALRPGGQQGQRER